MSVAIRFFHLASYLVFRLCEGLIGLLPLDYAFIVGRAGGELAYRILRRRRALALDQTSSRAVIQVRFGRASCSGTPFARPIAPMNVA